MAHGKPVCITCTQYGVTGVTGHRSDVFSIRFHKQKLPLFLQYIHLMNQEAICLMWVNLDLSDNEAPWPDLLVPAPPRWPTCPPSKQFFRLLHTSPFSKYLICNLLIIIFLDFVKPLFEIHQCFLRNIKWFQIQLKYNDYGLSFKLIATGPSPCIESPRDQSLGFLDIQ